MAAPAASDFQKRLGKCERMRNRARMDEILDNIVFNLEGVNDCYELWELQQLCTVERSVFTRCYEYMIAELECACLDRELDNHYFVYKCEQVLSAQRDITHTAPPLPPLVRFIAAYLLHR